MIVICPTSTANSIDSAYETISSASANTTSRNSDTLEKPSAARRVICLEDLVDRCDDTRTHILDYSVCDSPAKKATPNRGMNTQKQPGMDITEDMIKSAMKSSFAIGNEIKRKTREVLDHLNSVAGNEHERKDTRYGKASFRILRRLLCGDYLSAVVTGHDDYILLTKGGYLSGDILNYYRVILLERDENRSRMTAGGTTWVLSCIFTTYFMTDFIQTGYSEVVAKMGRRCNGKYMRRKMRDTCAYEY